MNMPLIVQKFGGTTVGSVERILKVAERIVEAKNKGKDVVVVVSAMGKSTNSLVDMAQQLSQDPPGREMDMLLASGEQVSISLLAMALVSKGYPAVSLTGWQAGIMTDSVHNKARIVHIHSNKILNLVNKGTIVIVAGFQGITEDGEVTTLGRGGSDTTAVALAASIKADLCEIYTDVSGVFSADPRVVPTAKKLVRISLDEMMELATLGAGVLHPRAVECAKKYNVRLMVRSSFIDEEGTFIEGDVDMEEKLVCGVTHKGNIVKITIKQFGALSSLFTILVKSHIDVDIIMQCLDEFSLTDLSFTVSIEDLGRTLKLLESNKTTLAFEELNTEVGLAKVSIVGAGLVSNPEATARMFTALASEHVPIKMVSNSEMKVSCIIPEDMTEIAVRTLHSVFGFDVLQMADVYH